METRDNNQYLIEGFRKHLYQEEKSSITVDKYVRDVIRFLEYINNLEITKEIVIDYKKHLFQKYAVRSVNSMLAGVNSFLRYTNQLECCVKSYRLQKMTYCISENELTKKEYECLLQSAKEDEQMRFVIETICATGIRVSELKFITIEALKQGEVTIICKNKVRRVFIPKKLQEVLLQYAEEIGIQTGTLFVTRGNKPLDRSYIWSKMKRIAEKAEIDTNKVYPHNLRKLFARSFYEQEKDIAKLSDVLGHSCIETTRIYIVTTGEEHRKQVDKLGLVM